MHPAIEDHRDQVGQLCRRFGVRRLEVFGSAARGKDFDPAASDADFLATFEPRGREEGGKFGAWAQLDQFSQALEAVLGRPVDLVDRGAVERSRLIDGYDTVSLERVWLTVRDDLAPLIAVRDG